MTPEQHSVWLATEAAGRFGLTLEDRTSDAPIPSNAMPHMGFSIYAIRRAGSTLPAGPARAAAFRACTCPVCTHMPGDTHTPGGTDHRPQQ